MAYNYTLHDILATAAVIPVFSIFLFAPGYSFGWATDLLQFRSGSVTRRLLLSLPFSIVISTVLANIVGRYIPAIAILWLFIVIAISVLIYGFRQWLRLRHAYSIRVSKSAKIAIAFAGIWIVVVIASLVDIEACGGLYMSTALWDHAVRIAFIHSALRSGPPPANPFSYLGSAPVARYYYYWYVLCSYPARLMHVNPRYVLYGSSVWAGFSLAALIPIYLWDFLGIREDLRRKSVLGIFLLSITGLDIIPTIYEFFRAKSVFPDMEWWDPVQITSWFDALIWVPHHVAALVACFIGFLALWSVRISEESPHPTQPMRIVAGIFAALAFAAAAGLSVYVTFTFALFLLCWGFRLIYKRSFADFFLYLWVSVLTVVISLPYLHDLLPPAATAAVSYGGGAAGGPIAFGLRVLPNFLSTPYFLKVRGFLHPELLAPFGVLVVYILEFGVFAIVGYARLRRDLRKGSKLEESEVASWYLLGISMFVITFVRSSVISNNDLAFRSAMIAQFILLLWGVEYLDGWNFAVRANKSSCITVKNTAILFALIFGFIGTLYGLAISRTYTILEDRGMIAHSVDWLPAPPRVGVDLLNVRKAYERLDKILPLDSIVQYNPMRADYLPLLMEDKFQSVDAFPDCGTEFGGDASECPPVQKTIANLFNKPDDYDIHEICARLSIDVLVARESDPAWRDPKSWVWNNPPIVENSYIRAFRCR